MTQMQLIFLIGMAAGITYLLAGLALMIWMDSKHNRIQAFVGDSSLRPFLLMLLWPLTLPLVAIPRHTTSNARAR